MIRFGDELFRVCDHDIVQILFQITSAGKPEPGCGILFRFAVAVAALLDIDIRFNKDIEFYLGTGKIVDLNMLDLGILKLDPVDIFNVIKPQI